MLCEDFYQTKTHKARVPVYLLSILLKKFFFFFWFGNWYWNMQ